MSLQLKHINPSTPAESFANEEFQSQTARYIVVAALTAIVWDVATNLARDFEIIQLKLSLSSIMYFISRTSVLATVMLSTIFSNSHESSVSCSLILSASIWLFTVALCSTSFLFFFRVRAVFLADHAACTGFLLLWLAVFGSCAYMPFIISAAPKVEAINLASKGGDQWCGVNVMETECVTCFAAASVYDTLVFLAVSWRLLRLIAAEEGVRGRARYFFGRDALPVISGTILQGGQQYYGVAVCTHIVAIATMHGSGIPRAVCVALMMPYLVAINATACKVFRDVRLGISMPGADFPSVISDLVIRFEADASGSDDEMLY